MKNPLALCLLILVGVALQGCNTPESRIARHTELFSSLPPSDQQRLRQGRIAVGDSPDMVYIALGAPDSVHGPEESNTPESRWVYYRIQEIFDSREVVREEFNDADLRFLGYRSHGGTQAGISNDPRITDPVFEDVMVTTAEADLVVRFVGKRVSAIERVQR